MSAFPGKFQMKKGYFHVWIFLIKGEIEREMSTCELESGCLL